MSAPKTYDQCLDRCEESFGDTVSRGEFSVGFAACLDHCDERFAAGKEPAALADFGVPAERKDLE